ncbi:MAG: serine/threonine-protein kinase [Bacteroidota bacterium]
MNEARWNEIERLLDEAAALPPSQQAAYLREATPDAELRAEVEALLAADAEATVFFANLGEALVDEALGGDPALESEIGRWRLVERVGRGGMGTVYRAERADGVVQQRAALKLLDTMRPDVVARFAQERQILARLDHPSIARLVDGGATVEGRPYLVMEYVDGLPITDYAAQQRLSVDDRLALFGDVCAAVQHAHQNLVVHRDLKPSNVLVTPGGPGQPPRVKLLDFGIARLLELDDGDALTRTEQRLLTPEYAAPEQVQGEAVTTATDVYALGVLLYELLAGTRPFDLPKRVLHEVARVIVEEEPERPSTAVTRADALTLAVPPQTLRRRLAGDLDQICLKALRKTPARRYATPEALARDVQRHLDGHPVEARPAAVGYRFARYVRRHREGLALAAVLLIAGLAFGAWHVQRLRTERDRAERMAAYTIDLFTTVDPLEAESLPPDAPFADVLRLASERAARDLDGVDRFDLLRVLGRTRRSLGDTTAYAYAQDLYDRAVTDFGLGSVQAAQAATERAWVAGGHETRTVADSIYRATLDLWDAHAATHPEGLASLQSDYGFFLKKDPTRTAEAEAYFAQAVGVYRALGDVQRENLATSLMHYATVLAGLDRHDEAARTIAESIALSRELYGETHASYGIALANAATVAGSSGDQAETARLNRLALEAFAAAGLPDDHELVLQILSNHAVNTADPAEAVRLHRRILAVRESQGEGDADHPSVLQNLGVALRDEGQVAAAQAMLQRARAAYLASSDAERHIASFPLLTLAHLHLDEGEPAAAQPYAAQAVRELTARLGTEHGITQFAAGLQAWADLELGASDEAARRLQSAIDALAEVAWAARRRDVLMAAAERLAESGA